MSSTWIGLAVMPVVFFLVIVMECSRLHCAQTVQRRLVQEARRQNASGQASQLAETRTSTRVPLAVKCAVEGRATDGCSGLRHGRMTHPGTPAWAGPGE